MKILLEYENKGTKEIQEDVSIIFETDLYECFFLFDGHGIIGKDHDTSLVHYFIKNNYFRRKFISFFTKFNINKQNLISFFKKLDEWIIKSYKYNSGTCFAGLIKIKNKSAIFLLHTGDVEYHIFNTKLKKIFSCEVHDLKNKKEINRINSFSKSCYIKNNRYKKLSMTRTLGDKDCKDLFNEPLIAIPEIKEINIKNNLIFFFTTDGIRYHYDIIEILKRLRNPIDSLNLCKEISEKNNLQKKYSIDNIKFFILSSDNIELPIPLTSVPNNKITKANKSDKNLQNNNFIEIKKGNNEIVNLIFETIKCFEPEDFF